MASATLCGSPRRWATSRATPIARVASSGGRVGVHVDPKAPPSAREPLTWAGGNEVDTCDPGSFAGSTLPTLRSAPAAGGRIETCLAGLVVACLAGALVALRVDAGLLIALCLACVAGLLIALCLACVAGLLIALCLACVASVSAGLLIALCLACVASLLIASCLACVASVKASDASISCACVRIALRDAASNTRPAAALKTRLTRGKGNSIRCRHRESRRGRTLCDKPNVQVEVVDRLRGPGPDILDGCVSREGYASSLLIGNG